MAKRGRVPKEYLGAFKAGHRATSREFIDDEFSFELLARAETGDEKAKEALVWLAKFNNERYKCVFKKDGTDLHRTADERKAHYNAQYARYMDAMTRVSKDAREGELTEDDVNALVDLKREAEKTTKN